MVRFGTLHPDGSLSDEREIADINVAACPFWILVADHYREDGTCKCDDPDERAKMIREWGYPKAAFTNIPLRRNEA